MHRSLSVREKRRWDSNRQLTTPTEGMAADFFAISLDRIELVGGQYDPKSLLSCIGFKGAVDYTVVNGKVVVEQGRLVNVEEEKIVSKANAAVEKLLNIK